MKRARSSQLSLYKKSYKGGCESDWHFKLFQVNNLQISFYLGALQQTKSLIGVDRCKSVLYPGSHRHLTASLVFPSVVYVDCDPKVAPLFTDPLGLAYIDTNKDYADESALKFLCKNFERLSDEEVGAPVDLLLSFSAGIVSTHTAKHVGPGGHFLCSDAHADARLTFLDQHTWKLKAVWLPDTLQFDTSEETLQRCFQVVHKDGSLTPISKEQVEESIAVGAKSKRKFKLLFEPMIYLFEKRACNEEAQS